MFLFAQLLSILDIVRICMNVNVHPVAAMMFDTTLVQEWGESSWSLGGSRTKSLFIN